MREKEVMGCMIRLCTFLWLTDDAGIGCHRG